MKAHQSTPAISGFHVERETNLRKEKKKKRIYNWSRVILDLGSQLAIRIIWEGDTLEDFAF